MSRKLPENEMEFIRKEYSRLNYFIKTNRREFDKLPEYLKSFLNNYLNYLRIQGERLSYSRLKEDGYLK